MSERQRKTMMHLQRIRLLAHSQDLYRVLEVSKTVSTQEIKTAYRKVALIVAPDKNPGVDTTEIFQMVNRAYEILSDDRRRRDYDAGGEREEVPAGDDEDREDSMSDLLGTIRLTIGARASD